MLREVQFRERLRGYNPDDVDAFLERVAAGVEVLEERLRHATERAEQAEQRVAEDGTDGAHRTLRLAQRTADLAVQEAREEAARLREQAEADAADIVAVAEEQARCLAEEAQSAIWADVERLEAARDQLTHDVAELARYVDAERRRARRVLSEAASWLAEPPPESPAPPPVHEVDLSGVRRWGEPSASDPVEAADQRGTLTELHGG